jgi:D-3-phosphoglycerate dehydrogenase
MFIRAGNWTTREEAELPGNLVALDLYQKTIGIIGMGAIGSRVARIAHGFNMKVLTYDPYISPDTAIEHQVEIRSLETLLKESDFVSIHTPSSSETWGMISTPELNLMKPSAYLLNASRGDVVDEMALIQALREKKLAGAGLDVFKKEPIDVDNPLLSFDNVILSPHCAGNSQEALDITSMIVAEETIRILHGKVPKNLVNRTQLSNHEVLR